MKSFRLLKINNQVSDMLFSCSNFGFLGKKVTILRKKLKIDNFLYCIKKQSKRSKELKYRRKNIVCFGLLNNFLTQEFQRINFEINNYSS